MPDARTHATEESELISEQVAGQQHDAEFARRQGRSGRRTQLAAGIVSALLLFGFIAVYAFKAHDAGQLAAATAADATAPPLVDVAIVMPAAAMSALTLPGQTAPWYGTTIYARVDGYVAKWLVDIGDHVEAGQVLAEIETPELDAQLDVARAKRNARLADVQVREAEARFADSTYRRWKESPKGVVSQQETEDKKAGYESAVAQLTSAHAEENLAQGQVDRLKAFEKFKQVTAPFKGTITQRKIDIGDLVTKGSTASTTPLYQLVQDDPIRVFVDVPQSAAASMKVGTAVDVTTSGTKARVYAGKITRTSVAVDPQARTLRVEVDIANHDESLVPGLYVDAAFHLESGGVSEIPAAALVFRAKGPQVAVVDGDYVKFRDVTIAEDDGSTVALASGVKDGDKVVLNISSEIADGEKIHVNDTDGNPAGTRAVSR
jgi:RND family efflux transporter MFP subunit